MLTVCILKTAVAILGTWEFVYIIVISWEIGDYCVKVTSSDVIQDLRKIIQLVISFLFF